MSATIVTRQCPRCGERGTVEVDDRQEQGYAQWLAGFGLVQDMLPTLPPELREQIMTGYHPACFNADFPPEDESGWMGGEMGAAVDDTPLHPTDLGPQPRYAHRVRTRIRPEGNDGAGQGEQGIGITEVEL